MFGCTSPRTSNPPPATTETAPTTAASTAEPVKKTAGAHPRDAENRLIFHKADGTCYVEATPAGPAPKDLMSGERWVENKPVACPSEFNDPAFAAIGEGYFWVKDEAKGTCAQQAVFGNPPPPAKEVPCPPSLQTKK